MIDNGFQSGEFQALTQVSNETLEMYKKYKLLLTHWNKKINLVSNTTISNFWYRHILDSHQLAQYIPANSSRCLDLGSGAGFPGLVMAINLRHQPDAQVTLVEANGKKCNFLRTVVRELNLPADIVQGRVESLEPQAYDIVSARAFAPLLKLFDYVWPIWAESTLGIFPKGESWKEEIESANRHWNFSVETRKSQTDNDARILLVKNLSQTQPETGAGGN